MKEEDDVSQNQTMTRDQYLAQVIRLYLDADGTPPHLSRSDWAVAADLFRRRVPLEHIAHAIRLASLRRQLTDASPVHSLAYYRAVLDRLEPAELEPGYIDYVRPRHCTNGKSSPYPVLTFG